MNKQEIEKAIHDVKAMAYGDMSLRHVKEKTWVDIVYALTQQLNPEPTAIEFLRKAKAIHDTCSYATDLKCGTCPINCLCDTGIFSEDESDLVRKVMDYRLEEPSEATKA